MYILDDLLETTNPSYLGETIQFDGRNKKHMPFSVIDIIDMTVEYVCAIMI